MTGTFGKCDREPPGVRENAREHSARRPPKIYWRDDTNAMGRFVFFCKSPSSATYERIRRLKRSKDLGPALFLKVVEG